MTRRLNPHVNPRVPPIMALSPQQLLPAFVPFPFFPVFTLHPLPYKKDFAMDHDALMERQIELERSMQTTGQDAYWKHVDTARAGGASTPRLSSACVEQKEPQHERLR